MSSERAYHSAAYRLLPDDLHAQENQGIEEGAVPAQCGPRMALSPAYEREVRFLTRIFSALSSDAQERLFAEIEERAGSAERGTRTG